MIHTVFFDCGGTLISGKSTLLAIAEEMDKDKSLDIFQFLIDSFMEIYLDENPPRFYSIKEILTLTTKVAAKEFGIDDISHRAVDFYRHQHLNNDYLYDDTIPTLSKLQEQQVKMILVSDADSDVLLEQLRMYDILKYFEATIISDQTQAYKPSDTVVQKALQYCQEPLSGILFVGDIIVDKRTAEKMGVKFALINRNGKFKLPADYQIKSLEEIFSIKE
jgi:putative hydrolase of the HAD superfamily